MGLVPTRDSISHFYLVLMNLHNHMWPVAVVLVSAALGLATPLLPLRWVPRAERQQAPFIPQSLGATRFRRHHERCLHPSARKAQFRCSAQGRALSKSWRWEPQRAGRALGSSPMAFWRHLAPGTAPSSLIPSPVRAWPPPSSLCSAPLRTPPPLPAASVPAPPATSSPGHPLRRSETSETSDSVPRSPSWHLPSCYSHYRRRPSRALRPPVRPLVLGLASPPP